MSLSPGLPHRGPKTMPSCPAQRGRDATFGSVSTCERGWDAEGPSFDVSEAVRAARARMKRRLEAGHPALSGMFTHAEVTYAWPRDDGTVGSDREPVALFTGEAVHAHLGHLSDAAIEAMLNELATELGAAWAGAHLCRVRRPDMDFGCRRASRVTRGPVCWR
jgi:hypothetical protein